MKLIKSIYIEQVLIPKGPKMETTVLFRIVCLLACLILLNGCDGEYDDLSKYDDPYQYDDIGKYDDLIKASEEFRKAVDTFIADVEKAGSAKGVARALNSYVDECEHVIPALRKQFEKSTELKNLTLDTAPDELVDQAWKVKETIDKMENSRLAQMKMDRYENDPDVQKAFKRLCDTFGHDFE